MFITHVAVLGLRQASRRSREKGKHTLHLVCILLISSADRHPASLLCFLGLPYNREGPGLLGGHRSASREVIPRASRAEPDRQGGEPRGGPIPKHELFGLIDVISSICSGSSSFAALPPTVVHVGFGGPRLRRRFHQRYRLGVRDPRRSVVDAQRWRPSSRARSSRRDDGFHQFGSSGVESETFCCEALRRAGDGSAIVPQRSK